MQNSVRKEKFLMDDLTNRHALRIGAEAAPHIAGLMTQYDIFRFMKALTESWQMKAFMVLDVPAQIHGDIGDHTIINNWPAELLNVYDNERFFVRSNVMRELQRAHLPFIVDLKFMARGLDETWVQNFSTQFSRFSMENAIWCPVQDTAGNRGAVGLSGMRSDFGHTDLAEFFYLAACVYGRLSFVKNLDARSVAILSDREIDCLNWTASGKTSAEIAEIMQLSEHTVNHYLNRATKKLDTVNRTQAVAKALRIGLIK
jgi:LuxR family quorum sensing-dependent transcriptional regulator